MTFDDVFEQLAAIDKAAVPLLKTAASHPDEGLRRAVRPLADTAQDSFLREQTENLLESLALFHAEFCYLTSPVSGEYQLTLFPNGRYGFFDGNIHTLSCGKAIEAKLHDSHGRPCWVKSRIEHDGNDYFLWGYPGIPLAGLTIRERKVADYDL